MPVRTPNPAKRRPKLFGSVSLLLLCLLCAPALSEAQRGALTVPQALPELVDEAGIIVRGHVLSARVEPHPEFQNLYTVVVTLRVERTLKGEPHQTCTRQFIWDVRDRYNAAGYQKGQHLLLLLLKPNQHGLASPVGLEQGRFAIERGPADTLVTANGAANTGLFSGLESALEKKGAQVRAQPGRREQGER
ncbi:MAG: hypothetical protein ACRD4T_09190 [Candidatus Acidiferrales bacterium]